MDAKVLMALAVLIAIGRNPSTFATDTRKVNQSSWNQDKKSTSDPQAQEANPASANSASDSSTDPTVVAANSGSRSLGASQKSLNDSLYIPRPTLHDGAPTPAHIYSSCDEGKGCIGSVPGCASSTCGLLVTFRAPEETAGGYYRFELMGTLTTNKGYVAVGISKDSKMGDDSVVECVVDSKGKPGVFMSWNTIHNNARLLGTRCDSKTPQKGPITGCNVTLVDGKILCNFYRQAVTQIRGRVFDLDSEAYYILVAIGHHIRSVYVKAGSEGNIGSHIFSFASRRSMILRAGTDEDGSEADTIVYLKLHGVFMIIAWLVLVPNAHFIIRYMRESWTDATYFGFPHSVFIHTTVMCTAAMFMAAALTCGVWHSIAQQSLASQFEERLHTIVGSVVLVLFVIQLFLGYLRPKAAPVRTVVNIVHFFVGTITYFASMVLILRGHKMTTSLFPCSSSLLIIIWILWSVGCHTITSIQILRKDNELKLATRRALLPWPFVIKVDSLPGPRYRLNVFAFHAAGACIISTMLILPYLTAKSGCTCNGEVCFQFSAG